MSKYSQPTVNPFRVGLRFHEIPGTRYIQVGYPSVKLSQVVSHRRSLYPQSSIAPQAGRRVVVEFEHTLPVTRSQPPGVWRVVYDSSNSAVT